MYHPITIFHTSFLSIRAYKQLPSIDFFSNGLYSCWPGLVDTGRCESSSPLKRLTQFYCFYSLFHLHLPSFTLVCANMASHDEQASWRLLTPATGSLSCWCQWSQRLNKNNYFNFVHTTLVHQISNLYCTTFVLGSYYKRLEEFARHDGIRFLHVKHPFRSRHFPTPAKTGRIALQMAIWTENRFDVR